MRGDDGCVVMMDDRRADEWRAADLEGGGLGDLLVLEHGDGGAEDVRQRPRHPEADL
jgi:hypothetical protein